MPVETPSPVGADPGLYGPGSVTWRLHADPLMLVGGLRALLLQALDPVVLSGFEQNSTYREDSWGRFFRTAQYVAVTTFGTADEAHRAGARVRGVHRRLALAEPGTGRTRRLSEPDLLLWVHCCLVDSFLDTGRRVGLVDAAGADAYVAEQVRGAALVGIDEGMVPATSGELADYLAARRPALRADRTTLSAARVVLAPPMPALVQLATPARPAWTSIAALAMAALPGWARRMYLLPVLPGQDTATTAGLRALRLSLMLLPPQVREGPELQAARRRVAA